MGSVKDLEVIEKPATSEMGVGRFHFSDRYSVFDWGEMPDKIPSKGAALCMMTAFCFEKLEENNVETHYRSLIDRDGKAFRFDDSAGSTSTMEVSLVNVYRPESVLSNGKVEYDYGFFTSKLRNFLIPLEIIYRNGLPEGSSVFRRLKEGALSLEQLGLDHYPNPEEHLEKPIFDVSTKLEEKDRYVDWAEAQRIAGLTDQELKQIKALLLNIDNLITQIAEKAHLRNEDGKIELAFDPERRLMVVDAVGTLDECRFTFDDLQVSKEIARQFYKKTQWYRDIEEAKRSAEQKGIKSWKSLCLSQPPPLDAWLKAIISEMYMASANEITGRRLFDAPSLANVVDECREYEMNRND
jgi:phosphoribosylaminoimidazole-succinocarboxamide synthase